MVLYENSTFIVQFFSKVRMMYWGWQKHLVCLLDSICWPFAICMTFNFWTFCLHYFAAARLCQKVVIWVLPDFKPLIRHFNFTWLHTLPEIGKPAQDFIGVLQLLLETVRPRLRLRLGSFSAVLDFTRVYTWIRFTGNRYFRASKDATSGLLCAGPRLSKTRLCISRRAEVHIASAMYPIMHICHNVWGF
jgi:hypothetical protein